MKPEAQRIAMTEACPNIRLHPLSNNWQWTRNEHHVWHQCFNNDPLNDLNAMHEAEKMILAKSDGVSTPDLFDDYCQHLGGSLFHCAHATAAQRAEAFLRTLGLWK